MFAARAGAKHVFAVDASDIAAKARQNVKENDLEGVITYVTQMDNPFASNSNFIYSVIQGKVEDVQLPSPYEDSSVKVDVIISEWMGYALLYESMLDSVLVARDRFLRKPSEDDHIGGVMAPSQCQMIITLGDASDIIKDRVTFWEDVYGKLKSESMHMVYHSD